MSVEAEQPVQEWQEPPPNYGDAAYAPPVSGHSANISELTNPENDLVDFELFLRSMRRDHNKNITKIAREVTNEDGTKTLEWKPLLNESGINMVMGGVQSVVHQMNALSNFDDLVIEYLMETLKVNLIKEVMLNRLSYDVERKNRDLIVGNSLRFAYTFALRAFNEGDKKFWSKTSTEISHNQSQPRQSGSTMNPFGWFGRK